MDDEFILGHYLYELLEIDSLRIVNVNLKYYSYIIKRESLTDLQYYLIKFVVRNLVIHLL